MSISGGCSSASFDYYRRVKDFFLGICMTPCQNFITIAPSCTTLYRKFCIQHWLPMGPESSWIASDKQHAIAKFTWKKDKPSIFAFALGIRRPFKTRRHRAIEIREWWKTSSIIESSVTALRWPTARPSNCPHITYSKQHQLKSPFFIRSTSEARSRRLEVGSGGGNWPWRRASRLSLRMGKFSIDSAAALKALNPSCMSVSASCIDFCDS